MSQPSKTRFDLEAENFDLYFASLLPSISPQAKEALPQDVRFKLFRRGAQPNVKNTNKLSFIAKLFILWKALRRNWFIILEAEDGNGLSVEDFVELKQAIKVRDFSIDRAKKIVSTGTFVTGSKELCDAMSYLNQLSTSPAYNFLMKQKNMPKGKASDRVTESAYLVKFLIHYEQSKKKINQQNQINPPEWYVLLGLYDGIERNGAILYDETFRYCYQSSKTKIKMAFGTLQYKGMITKYGEGRGAKFRITPLGIALINEIFNKHLLVF